MRRALLLITLLLVTASHLPAPIQEESPAATPQRTPKPKPKPSESNVKAELKPSATPAKQNRFAGTWSGVMSTFPWGDISQTIIVDPTEATMTMMSTDKGTSKVVRVERRGETLIGNFGTGGTYSLTPLGDGTTALVRLQAPFNDNTASYRRVAK